VPWGTLPGVTIRQRRVDLGDERGRRLVALVASEFGAARRNAGLSQEEVAHAVGVSRAQYGRIELGLSPEVAVAAVARIAAVLGLDTSLKLYPTAEPIRDAAHAALLERLHAHCHASLRWQTEVPLPRPGDLRAWDAMIRGFRTPEGRGGIRGAVEAETRPTDAQALDRKLALKERDGGVDWLILLLADTRHNRSFLHGPATTLRARFPMDGRRALELLAAGVDPGSNAIIVL
jgi:transcriptional regulator with XRE-family HTH domain